LREALKIGQENPTFAQPNIGNGQPVLHEGRCPARFRGRRALARTFKRQQIVRHLDAVIGPQAHGMRDAVAIDLDAVGAAEINEPKLPLLLMNHGVVPGDLGRREYHGISLNAAESANAVQAYSISILAFQPRAVFAFINHCD
jgi:hypothetical protein